MIGSLYLLTQTTQSATLTQVFYQFYDNMGRPSRSFQYENSDPAKPHLTNDIQYDVMNRVWRVSNTYRSTGSASAINPSGNWTTTQYDKLGRVSSVTTPDYISNNPPISAVVTTSYSGNQVTVTDQAGKKRRSLTDALGRLTQVVEDPTGLAYQTDYTYDALGNLRKVTQGTQSRYFMYDSLSRLIRAKNPEQNVNASLTGTDAVTGNSQWSISYAYDANGNLTTKTDARNLTASYSYDFINRNTQISFSDGTVLQHLYDSATNGRGRSRAVFYYVNSGAHSQSATNNYDAVGRPLDQLQYFYAGASWGAPYTVSRTYDLVGHVTSQTYPSGRTVSYSYDRIGRTTSFTGNLGDSLSRTYMSAIAFDDSGRMIREQFGTTTPLYHKQHWNVRGQLYDMRLSTVNDDSNWNRGAVINYYSLSHYCFGCSGADNNGNLQIQQHYVPGDDLIQTHTLMQQNYAYDSLNRLSWAQEYIQGSGNTPGGGQSYSYDRWGNRTLTGSGTGINTKQFTIDGATNRYGVPAGQAGVMQYDGNGNLTNDTYSSFGTRTYDAENRMVTAVGSGGSQSIYTYDGDGRRVRRQTGTQTVWQVYGMNGELVAEYAANGSVTAPQKEYGYRNGELLVTAQASANVQWMVTDQLGTPRIIADRTGSLSGIRRHDYMPFGEELFAGSGNRTAAGGYAADSVRQKFTGKERDTETGLDYFGARYYSSAQGRFASADEPFADQRPTNAQSWNLYTYVQNNPCNLVDPNGRCSAPSGLREGGVGICIEAFIAAPRIGPGGIAHGDGRTFDGDNPNLTSRVQVQIILTATKDSIDISSTSVTAGASTVSLGPSGDRDKSTGRSAGEGEDTIALRGIAEAKASIVSTDARQGTDGFGNNTVLNVTGTGKNGFQAAGESLQKIPALAPVVVGTALRAASPSGTIDFNVNLRVSGSGNGEFVSGDSRGYPSYAAYSYQIVNGQMQTTTLFRRPENNIEDLNRPMTPIPK